jgi:hypothetical protein
MAVDQSGTFKLSRGTSAGDVETACSEMERALAEAVACLYFLSELTTGESATAVSNAHLALLRIRDVVDGLRQGYPHATRSESSGARTAPG